MKKSMNNYNAIIIFHRFYFYTFKTLNAFKIAIIETPTSAKTASHIVDIPKALKTRTAILIKIAKN